MLEWNPFPAVAVPVPNTEISLTSICVLGDLPVCVSSDDAEALLQGMGD